MQTNIMDQSVGQLGLRLPDKWARRTHWIVATRVDADCIFDWSALESIVDLIDEAHEPGATMIFHDNEEIFLAVDPARPDVFPAVERFTTMMAAGEHPDIHHYSEMLDEAVCDRWADMTLIERLETAQLAGLSNREALDDPPPPDIMVVIQESLEHR